jgi:hypothetical protein
MATTKKTPLQKVREKKKLHCEGKASKDDVKIAAQKYLDNVKVKDHDAAKKKVKEILEGGCAVSGTKRKPKRQTTTAKSKKKVAGYVSTTHYQDGKKTMVVYSRKKAKKA